LLPHDQRRGLPPHTLKHKALDRPAHSWCQFTLLEIFGQDAWIPQVTEHDPRHWFEAIRNAIELAHPVWIESGHLMHKQPKGRRLSDQIGDRQADIMEGMAIGLAVGIERELGNRYHEDRRARSPLLIVLAEATQEARMLGCMLLGRDNEVPRLLVGRGS
jgi:hypothetical protein